VDDRFSLDAAAIRRSFNAAAATFDSHAVLHSAVRQRALERLKLLRAPPAVILDLGSGTGLGSRWLKSEFPQARILAVDSALQMTLEHRKRTGGWRRLLGRAEDLICGDARSLPLRDASVDWIFANLLVPWCGAPDKLFAEAARILKPGGSINFSSYGPDTLLELRRAWSAIDAIDHVHPFLDMHDLGTALSQAGFAEPVLDVERFTLTYPNLEALRRDLKSTGSRNALPARCRGLRGRSLLTKLSSEYERHRRDGKLPASVEIVYGQAWRGQSLPSRGASKEIRVPLDSLRTRR
jgi:malonyl-CoA O-methyltransferase